MVWILRILNLTLFLSSIWFFLTNPQNLKIILVAIALLFFISGIRKAFILGIDSLRGKFWVLLSLTAIFFSIAVYSDLDALHIFTRLYILLCLSFMLLGLIRQGLILKGLRLGIWLLGALISIVLSFLFFQILPTKDLITFLYLPTITLNTIVLLANLLIYFGSDLGIRWFLGFISFSFLIIGDLIYLSGNNSLAYFIWCFSYFFINLMAHIEE